MVLEDGNCHILLSWKESRIVRYCDLSNDHNEEPWSVQALQKHEWELERAEFYMDGQTGLLVLQNSEDAEEDAEGDRAIHDNIEGVTSDVVRIDPQHRKFRSQPNSF
jgi:hypothetical protein